VIADLSEREEINQASFFALGYHYSVALDKWNLSDMACDFVYLGNKDIDFEIPGTLGLIYNHQTWHELKEKKQCYPLFCGEEYFRTLYKSQEINFVAIDYSTLTSGFLHQISNDLTVVLILDSFHEHAVAEQRAAFFEIVQSGCKAPVIIKRNYRSLSDDDLQLYAASDFGSLFMDGYGNGTWLKTIDCGNPVLNNRLAFGVLQASRTRISKTEYIPVYRYVYRAPGAAKSTYMTLPVAAFENGLMATQQPMSEAIRAAMKQSADVIRKNLTQFGAIERKVSAQEIMQSTEK
jgi:(E)-4-hydroxy-3-methylbut-2-enyl-diphosphate synthase